MNSPEIAQFLSDLYDREYIVNPLDAESQPQEQVFGSVLYREAEDPFVFTPYREIMNNYTRGEIKKFFGYNLSEFLDLTLYEASVLLEQSELMKQELTKVMEDVKSETGIPDSIKSTYATPDDLENALTGDDE